MSALSSVLLSAVAAMPPSFPLENGAGKAVFVDITEAQHTLVYDVGSQRAESRSTLRFVMTEAGRPVFDLLPEPTQVTFDGKASSLVLTPAPGRVTQYRTGGTTLSAGEHVLEVTAPIREDVVYGMDEVRSAFFFSDLADRQYLEMYLPTGLEYDAYVKTFDIEVLNAKKPHEIFTNGKLTSAKDNRFRIEFPATYTASSPFYHLAPVGAFFKKSEVMTSRDGRALEVQVYGEDAADVDDALKLSIATLKELESDYGPFQHDRLLVFETETMSGGMEHCGATITNLWALPHEVTHSYFGRGIMPGNGDGGWIDEALASWRDDNYPRRATVGFERSNMGNRGAYVRKTDTTAYTWGNNFMGYLDGRIAAAGKKGGLKEFLADLFDRRDSLAFKPYTTAEFQARLQSRTGLDFTAEFNRYIYGTEGMSPLSQNEKARHRSPYHPELTREQRKNLL